jgi:hypothetical protein
MTHDRKDNGRKRQSDPGKKERKKGETMTHDMRGKERAVTQDR